MRVAQIIDGLRPAGGAERLQRSFAEAVRGQDIELTVVTLHQDDIEAERELEALGAKVVNFTARRFASARRALALQRFLKEERFDVLHAHLVRSTILGSLAARTVGMPMVATIHNTQRSNRLPRALDRAEAFALRHLTDRVIAVGWETARVHGGRLGGRAIEVIPNAVPLCEPLCPAERRKLRCELGVAGSTPLLVTVGRLHPQKAFPDLLRALVLLRDRGVEFQLRIAGAGRLEAELRREIKQLGLDGQVALLGLRRDVPRLLGASDVYVSSSSWEGLPVATLEAMAAGLPVVATAVGDVPQLVTADTGELVAPGDPDGLASSILRLIEDPGLRARQGAAARRRVAEHFGSDAWAHRILDLYRELCRSRGREASR
jgi:glycosyltransferase involved in cell wall biosynthesis